MLADAGPLIALLSTKDSGHHRCVTFLGSIGPSQLVVPWACFSEAMHILGRLEGASGQHALWQMVLSNRAKLHAANEAETHRMASLMSKYSDLPMDLGDASLVAAAESLGTRTVFTFDSHFLIYKLADGSSLQCVP